MNSLLFPSPQKNIQCVSLWQSRLPPEGQSVLGGLFVMLAVTVQDDVDSTTAKQKQVATTVL
jgi:hypothetical protein